MKIEKIVLAEEICEQNPEMLEKIEQLLKKNRAGNRKENRN